MSELTLFEYADTSRVVNVASVPQLSPFRYPGGKTWLVPRIRDWLRTRPGGTRHFIEPFAGGAIVALTVAFEALSERVSLVELDENIAAVWQTILSDDVDWLVGRIAEFHPTPESVLALLEQQPRTTRELAFVTLVRNRVSRGGILAPGAGLVKRGENGRGLASRWYPQTLCRRVRAIAARRHVIAFHHGDGLQFMELHAGDPAAAFFIDPPYVVAGKRLYLHNDIDHRRLFEIAAAVHGHVLITYDDAAEIRALADEVGFTWERVPMKTTHHRYKLELLVSRDLDWLRAPLRGAAASP